MTLPDGAPAPVMVIGAGIVGATIAHELVKRGHPVELVDRDAPGRGCSYGNSGAISEGSVVPLAVPGMLASVPRMLVDRDSPLHVPLAYLPRALPWLLRFVASARPARVAQSARALHELHAGAVARHAALAAEVGVPELVCVRGHLHLYRDEAALAKDAFGWNLRRQCGVAATRVDRAGIVALEPEVDARYTVGMFLADHAFVRNPFRYVEAIVRAFVARGGRLRSAAVTRISPRVGGCRVDTSEGARDAAAVVVATGASSRPLLDPLGLHVPLETQRGYHVEFDGDSPISRTVVLTDRKAFATPMESGLRVGGTVEIAGLGAAPDWRRAELLEAAAQSAFPSLQRKAARRWMGHRPCLPDSVPFIGRVGADGEIYAAVGHGHLGLTDAPATAERIAMALATQRR